MDEEEENPRREEDYVPQVLSYPSISEYLDSTVGIAIPKSGYKKEFIKYYKDSSLPKGCRIVHRKAGPSSSINVSYRSKYGRHFKSRQELIAFVDDCETLGIPEYEYQYVSQVKKGSIDKIQNVSRVYAENLYSLNDFHLRPESAESQINKGYDVNK